MFYIVLYVCVCVCTDAIESIITNNTLPINLENLTLTCEVTGPYDNIYWMKDNMYLNMNSSTSGKNMSYHVVNNMLYFTPVTLYNEGIYKCIATIQDRSYPSPPYELLVNCECLFLTVETRFSIVA